MVKIYRALKKYFPPIRCGCISIIHTAKTIPIEPKQLSIYSVYCMVTNEKKGNKHVPGDRRQKISCLFFEHHPRLFERLVVFITALALPTVVMDACGTAAIRTSLTVVIWSVITIEICGVTITVPPSCFVGVGAVPFVFVIVAILCAER